MSSLSFSNRATLACGMEVLIQTPIVQKHIVQILVNLCVVWVECIANKSGTLR
jgi:hypothetical protein